jgi:hypothetical protein
MEKIPTAKEFLINIAWRYENNEQKLIEFAKMHVEAALKEAKYCRTKECIQKCYSLDKIE